MPHLFVDISSHGFGHLAQTAPVLNALADRLPGLRITLRSGLPAGKLAERIQPDFDHLPAASDFGYVMHDALRIDLAATAAAYREAHTGFPARVATEAKLLKTLGVDAVFSNVAYLPLAGAADAGIPAAAMCSLNWADLFKHYFGAESWAAPIHAEILAAYRSTRFLRATPGMSMPDLDQVIDTGQIAVTGRDRREELRHKVGAGETAKIILLALGGIPTRLPVERWPFSEDIRWIIPSAWNIQRNDMHSVEPPAWPFVDLLRSVDAVVTKPGYGTFTEAVANGTAVIFQRRDDWPEQTCLIDWLRHHALYAEINARDLAAGNVAATLQACRNAPTPTATHFVGATGAACHLAMLLS